MFTCMQLSNTYKNKVSTKVTKYKKKVSSKSRKRKKSRAKKGGLAEFIIRKLKIIITVFHFVIKI